VLNALSHQAGPFYEDLGFQASTVLALTQMLRLKTVKSGW